MSNKTQLSTNNTQLASLIQELANKAAGGSGSGGANLDVCEFNISIRGLSENDNVDIFCAWSEFYAGMLEYVEDGSRNGIGLGGYPCCNTVLYTWWGDISGWSSGIEVSGATIIHQTANSAAILMPSIAGSYVNIKINYLR